MDTNPEPPTMVLPTLTSEGVLGAWEELMDQEAQGNSSLETHQALYTAAASLAGAPGGAEEIPAVTALLALAQEISSGIASDMNGRGDRSVADALLSRASQALPFL